MARLYLFAEGQTEQIFARTVLTPHLANYRVFLMNPVLISKGRKRGVTHRGGGSTYAPVKEDIQCFIKQEKSSDVFFTTMIDVYGLPKDFPGLVESHKLQRDPDQRVAFLEQSFAGDIGDRRFIPYLQLHEYEAYLSTGQKG